MQSSRLLPHHAPHLAMLYELGCVPLSCQYVMRALGLYNRLAKAGPSYHSLLCMHAREALRGGASPKVFWLRGLWVVLEALQPGRAGHWSRTFHQGLPIDKGQIGKLLREAFAQHIASFRGCMSGEGSRLGFYFREVADHTPGKLPQYLTVGLSQNTVRACLRFRLGCHHLRVQTGRWCQPPLPRERRLCQRCYKSEVDDEFHCLFRCDYRDLRRARARLCASVFGGSGHVPTSITHMSGSQSAHKANLARIARFVAECYCVAARCHAAGGTDDPGAARTHRAWVAGLLALLPECELDLFDSSDGE